MHARKIFMNSPLAQPTVARVRVSALGGLSQALPRFVDASNERREFITL
jgi:hypothetical protein